ncbi:MAG: hypothetical protein J7I99_01210 [Methanophagales archaeon]|nr:hypothetical protein [Methanophagales archaeon]
MSGEDACLVASALMPDNVSNIKTELKEKDGTAIIHLEASRIGTLIATIDDYLMNAQVAQDMVRMGEGEICPG